MSWPPAAIPVERHWRERLDDAQLETSLGLIPEAFEQRLRVMRPQLPDLIYWLEVRKLKVGSAHAEFSNHKPLLPIYSDLPSDADGLSHLYR